MQKQLNITTSLTALNLNATETKIAERILKGFFKIPEKERVDILKRDFRLDDYGKGNIKKIKVNEIVDPFAFRRLDKKDNYQDLEEINKLDSPKVIFVEAIKKYFIMDGYRVYSFQKGNDRSKVKVEVVGKAESLTQIAVARGMAMNVVNRPMSNLEMALGLHNLGEALELEFPDEFSKHGGNRKIKKRSLTDDMARLLNIKESTVRVLRNFARHFGPFGLVVLQKSDNFDDLVIRDINEVNARIKEKHFREEIELMKILCLGLGDTEEAMELGIGEYAAMLLMEEIEKEKIEIVPDGEDDSTGKSSEKKKGKKGKPKETPPTPKRKANFKELHKLIDDFSRKLVEVKKIVPEKGRVSDFPSERIKKPFENLQRQFGELIMSMKKLME